MTNSEDKNKIEKEQILEMNVYLAGKTMSTDGIDNNCSGMYALEYDGSYLVMSRCKIEKFPRDILIHLSCDIKPKYVNKVIINYPSEKLNSVSYLDGFFGRPRIFHDIQELKPLTKKDRKTLKDKINAIGSFDVKGKQIPIISN